MPSLKQRLRQLEIQREEAHRRQLAEFDVHRFLQLVRNGKCEAEIARALCVDIGLVRQAITQLQPPSRPQRRGHRRRV
ncbi:MAG: hypothetical protein ACYC5Y_03630 [Symbiobacteriia bacterium]